ncbi:hypothetical protein FLL45_01890 [Aliikangiella marina]|uniref:YebB family permuted papain-like enzyme n=1 Tax=Aliikangiella marina TaxID=1712262 RepID=A0A545THP4_9GAMM|nr:YiiX/YebB-like N1pC/P60 family cysteine hydrolase [Aliikangiella marina]TQV76732.1 hypothetical protein FLL45_01890 [Aliikangiella marina]
MIDQKTMSDLREGDIIFTSIPNLLYQSVERASNSPTSHVGILFKIGDDWVVAESRVPISCYTPLIDFVSRSKRGWVSVKRVSKKLTQRDITKLRTECDSMMGKLYHLGFKYRSNRQFCSKFVYDAYKKSLGINVGKLMTLRDLLEENPNISKTFWRFWYLGFIPWNRQTITPGSQYNDPSLATVI